MAAHWFSNKLGISIRVMRHFSIGFIRRFLPLQCSVALRKNQYLCVIPPDLSEFARGWDVACAD